MSSIFTQIPKLNNTLTKNNIFPEYLSLWEIILNQHFTQEQINKTIQETGDIEEMAETLLNLLYQNNKLYIENPETGEVLWDYINNEEYISGEITFTNNNREE